MAFSPYLFFGGNCRDAFTRYEQIFGGELFVMSSKDMPPGEEAPPTTEDFVMHAALTFDAYMLMGSDDPTTDSFGPVQGMVVSYNTPDVSEAERVFAALAEGGQVTTPIGPTFWSPMFGMCVDRFGTPWMIGADAPPDAS